MSAEAISTFMAMGFQFPESTSGNAQPAAAWESGELQTGTLQVTAEAELF